MSDASNWDEGGSNRIAQHVAGGALLGGLGGGSIGTALQGAAGAGLSAAMAKQLDDIYKGVGSATGSELLGNLAANVVAGVGGALVGGVVGATMASSVELYNQSAHRKKIDLVAQVCSGMSPCSESLVTAAINAQGANAEAVAGTLQPNYATLSFGILSGSAGGVINPNDGTKYLAVGVGQANPSSVPWSPGASATLGWIWGARTADATNAFLNGDGNQAFISIPTPWRVNAVGAVTHGYGGSTALEIGVGSSGGLSYGVVPWSHSTPIGNGSK